MILHVYNIGTRAEDKYECGTRTTVDTEGIITENLNTTVVNPLCSCHSALPVLDESRTFRALLSDTSPLLPLLLLAPNIHLAATNKLVFSD